MSDTEEEGTFDKEAEREKLREQLEREEEERRSTQHMSELLLKGATMTNKHCDTCGDPLFRYEGQEFCPTCSQQGGAGGEGESGQATAEAGTDDGAGAGHGSAASTTASPDPESAGIDRVETGAPASGGEARSSDARQSTRGAAGQRTATQAGGTAAGRVPGATGDAQAQGTAGDAGGDVRNARAALARKLSTLARQAEATDDVGRSRELLAAAREAAEALAAIDDVGR